MFAFSSELRSLLPVVGGASLDETALADYPTFLWVPDPRKAFRGIKKLPPGHYAWVDRDGMQTRQYWDPSFMPEARSEREWVDAVADAVTESVQRQMVSDFPLGAFLSGGVDSSAIVAAMASIGDQVSTYTIDSSARTSGTRSCPTTSSTRGGSRRLHDVANERGELLGDGDLDGPDIPS